MGYNTSNPPVPQSMGPLTGFNSSESTSAGGKLWLYKSADPIATVQGAGYFSNGIQLGMQLNDLVFVIDTNLNRAYICMVLSQTPVTPGPPGYGSVSLSSTTTPLID